MAIEKVVNIVVNEVGIDKAQSDATKLNNTLDNLEGTNSGLSGSFKESAGSILENGGAMGILNELTGGYAMTVKDAVEASGLFTKGQAIQTAAQKVYAAVVGTSTGALKAFKIALATTGIGVLIVALGFFVSAMADAGEATEEEKKNQEALGKQVENTIAVYKRFRDELTDYVTQSKLRAEIAGKSEKDLLQLELEASEERQSLLKAEEARLREQQQNRELSVEDNKKINDRLLEINREYIKEINGQEISRLQFEKEQADKRREAAKEAADKLSEEAKKRRDEALAAEKEFQKSLLEGLQEFNRARVAVEEADLDLRISTAKEKEDLLNSFQRDARYLAIEQEKEAGRQILDEAKATAEERFAFEEEIRNRTLALDSQIETDRINKISENFENEKLSFETRFALLDSQNKLILESEKITEAERTTLLAENTEARKKLSDAEFEHTKKNAQLASNVLNQASELAGKKTAAGKVLAVASATISTYVSAVDAYKGMVAAIPGPVGIAAGAVAAAFSIASGFATVKKILSVKTPGGGGDAGSATGGGAASPPSFNIVGQGSTNQLAQTLSGQNAEQQQPIKAYVVGSEVTTQQAADRNAIATATFN